MSTDTKNQDIDPDARWSRRAILRRAPNTDRLHDKQKDALVGAIRNPNAGAKSVCDEYDVVTSTLRNLLWNYRRGAYEDGYEVTDYDPVLNEGSAKFKERTVKQRAGIDFIARHPRAFDDLTYEEVADTVAEELGVTAHWSTIYYARRDFPGLIDERRKWYESNNPDAVERFGADASGHDSADKGKNDPIRVKLVEAGFTDLPDENLDDLPTAETAAYEGRQLGGETQQAAETGDVRHDESFRQRREEWSSGDDEAEEAGRADVASVTKQERGQTTYTGPEGGVDTTDGREPSLLFERSDDATADEAVEEMMERVREEEGELGEDAWKRDVSIDSKEDLVGEIRRLRAVVSAQGTMLGALRDTLENLSVDVTVGVDDPDEQDAGASDE